MRPMKLAGSKLMFGKGCLPFLAQLNAKKVTIVIGGHSMEKSGNLDKVKKILRWFDSVDILICHQPHTKY